MMARFASEDGKHHFEVSDGEVVVGRAPDATARIHSLSVDKHHARVTFRGGACEVQDLGSTSGIFVNDSFKSRPTALLPGDRLRIGGVVFSVEFVASDASALAAPLVDASQAPSLPAKGGSVSALAKSAGVSPDKLARRGPARAPSLGSQTGKIPSLSQSAKFPTLGQSGKITPPGGSSSKTAPESPVPSSPQKKR